MCEVFLEKNLSLPRALMTTSCTDALEMSAILLDIKPGDEVILPSFTFVSTVNAFVLHGAKPVFSDIREDTLNIDERKIENLITERTKAIIPVHYAGVACEMDRICEIADKHRIKIVEDNAHGLFGEYKGKHLGTFGALATQSFHETKNFNCGEGGALLINDESLIERAEIIREKGTNRSQFYRGQVDKYTWVDVGSSYLPSDMLAAYLYAQFEIFEEIQARREFIWEFYSKELAAWAKKNGVRCPYIPNHSEQAYHMFYLIFPTKAGQASFIAHMKSKNIICPFHYLPLHLSGMGEKFGGRAGDCPVTEDIANRLVRLPLFNDIDDHMLDRIASSVFDYKI
jgi:dTDP-4-amino-4,6-dideoxygalactose transaminase